MVPYIIWWIDLTSVHFIACICVKGIINDLGRIGGIKNYKKCNIGIVLYLSHISRLRYICLNSTIFYLSDGYL